jgi:peptide/nickel transport system substrate-binding protein
MMLPHWCTRLSIVLVLALAGAAVVGCQEEPTEAPPPPTTIAAEALPTPEPDPETLRLVFGHPEDATKLDPSDVTDGESLLVTWHIYDGLTRYKRGGTEVEPALAKKWEASEDGLEWTFELREGVTFHDGTDFDADAVVWNFDRWFDQEHPYHFDNWDFVYWPYMFQGFKDEDKDEDGEPDTFFVQAEAVDPLTVKLRSRRRETATARPTGRQSPPERDRTRWWIGRPASTSSSRRSRTTGTSLRACGRSSSASYRTARRAISASPRARSTP